MATTAGGDALYAWGRADYGCSGLGKQAAKAYGGSYSSPVRVPIPHGVLIKQITAGSNCAMALTIDNELYTWGYEGTTGHGGYYLDNDCTVPLKLEVPGVKNVWAMDGGSQHGIMLVEMDQTKPADERETHPKKKKRRV